MPAEQTGLVEQVITAPWIWLVFALLIIYLIVSKYKDKGQGDPSTKPWWGRQVRRDVTVKDAEKRMNTLGKKCKVTLEKGIATIGLVEFIEYDKMLFNKLVVDQRTKKREWKPDYYFRVDRLKFRQFGFWAWFKALFGYGYSFMNLTPDSYTHRVEKGKRFFNVDPSVHLINDSGIWTVANIRAVNASDEFSLQAWNENLHGSELDMLRRTAVHAPSVATVLEKASHEANLAEQARKNKMQPYM